MKRHATFGNFLSMTEDTTDCPFDHDMDIEARYLSGRLSEEEAEAFEAHYFACDRCFSLVQRGVDLRAAAALPVGTRAHRRARWWPSLAAAAVLIVAAGLWRVRPGHVPSTAFPNVAESGVLRGASSMLGIHASASTSAVLVTWASREGASTYRVRLLGDDGSLLSERELTDTSARLALPLHEGERPGSVYVEVQALGPLRDVIAASSIVRASRGSGVP